MRARAVFVVMVLGAAGCEAGDEGGDGQRDPCAVCAADERCEPGSGEAVSCVAVCAPPRLPRFETLPLGAVLPLDEGAEVAVIAEEGGDEGGIMRPREEDWRPASAVGFERLGATWVHARWREAPAACAGGPEAWPTFAARYTVVERLAAADETEGAYDAVASDDARISAWASGWVEPIAWGGELDPTWQKVEPALGPATGEWFDAVSLGNGGALTFTFDRPIADGPGLDLAVFENGFSAAFLELGWVEVSSDGVHFARFPSLSWQREPVAAYGTLDAREVLGVAGRYAGGYGTGFDLAHLADSDAVLSGRVDPAAIRFVRVVDIVGGVGLDALGQPIYDPTPTFGPAGFDVEAIAVLREAGARP